MSYKKHISKIDTDLVIEIICGYLKIKELNLFEKDSDKKIVHARFMVFFVLCRIFKLDHTEVGQIFNMDHSNVYYGCEKILGNIVLYRESKTEYNDIRKLIMKRMKDIIIVPEADDLKLK